MSERGDKLRRQAAEQDGEAETLEKQARYHRDTARAQRKSATQADLEENARIPVDRSAVTLTDGRPVDPNHRDLKPNGQQQGYVVLSDEERAKGFVRPVRESYKHLTCGAVTTMGRALAETYARDPAFYSGTFCATCQKHFPVGDDGEFVWAGTEIKVGT